MTFDPPEDEETQGRWKRNHSEESGSRVGRIVLFVIGGLLLLVARDRPVRGSPDRVLHGPANDRPEIPRPPVGQRHPI